VRIIKIKKPTTERIVDFVKFIDQTEIKEDFYVGFMREMGIKYKML
jgi:hypothetical protein